MSENTHAVSLPNQPKMTTIELVRFNLAEKYMVQATNFYDGDKRAAMRFMTGFIDYIRRVPKLMECTPISLVNSAMMIASFRFTPSSVAGEAYLVPYSNKGVMEAQFQPGYQGYITLFYRAGVQAIQAEIVRDKDEISIDNGIVSHKVDPRKSNEERGKAIGAYVRVVLPSGKTVYKYMNETDILAHAKRFSKSYFKYDYKAKKMTDEISNDTPWNPKNDPELNMWKKTVLLQMKSILPKNSELVRAMEQDFKESPVTPESPLDAAGPATARASHKPEIAPAKEPQTATGGPRCPAGKHPADKMSTGECEYCTNEEFDQRPAEEKDK